MAEHLNFRRMRPRVGAACTVPLLPHVYVWHTPYTNAHRARGVKNASRTMFQCFRYELTMLTYGMHLARGSTDQQTENT